MKRKLGVTLITATAGFAAAGFFLRRWQVAAAFEKGTGLLIPGSPATAALLVMLAVAAAVELPLCWRMFREEAPKGYLANLAAPNMALGVAAIVAGALLFAGGALGIRDYVLHMDGNVVRLTLGICLVPTGICVGLAGLLGQQREEAKGRFQGALLAPGYCGCVWLVAAYQGHTANPNIMEYMFLLVGIVCEIFASYAAASFSFEKPRPVLCGFCSAMGAVLLTVSAADHPWGMDMLAVCGFGLYLMAQFVCLVWCRMRPPKLEAWTPPPEEKKDGETKDGEKPETRGEMNEAFQETAEASGETREQQDQPRGEEDE